MASTASGENVKMCPAPSTGQSSAAPLAVQPSWRATFVSGPGESAFTRNVAPVGTSAGAQPFALAQPATVGSATHARCGSSSSGSTGPARGRRSKRR